MTMLTISRRGGLVLTLLAAFYFVIGAHILHSHYHDHDHDHGGHEPYDGVKTVLIVDNSASGGLESAEGDNRLCPICAFLALCSVIQPGGMETTVQSPISPKAAAGYVDRILATTHSRSHIRGPPGFT